MQQINNQPYLCRDCKEHLGLIDPEEERKKYEIKTANIGRGTICIFGFDFHTWFCICDLVNVNPNYELTLICDKCSGKFREAYESFLSSHESIGWDGEFEDYLSIFIEEKMDYIRNLPLHEFGCNLAKQELGNCKQKFKIIYDRYMKELI